MGRGNKIFKNNTNREPYFIEDENDLDREWHNYDEKEAKTELSDPQYVQTQATLNERTALADMFYNKTLEQAELIGQLKARIKELEQRLEKTAGNANTEGIANVG